MKKYFLLVLLFSPFFLCANIIENTRTDLNYNGAQAYRMHDYAEAFCLFDMQLVYFRKDENALSRLEAQIGRYCAAYRLGYNVLTDNDFYFIYSLKYKTQTIKELLEKYPESMIDEARQIVELIYYSRNTG
jgi:hypothetical protein